jgi:hypothetical protein
MGITKIYGENGEEIYFQFDSEEIDELHAVGGEDIVNNFVKSEKFHCLIADTVKNYSSTILNSIKKGVDHLPTPESIALEFGIQIGGETGIPFITKGSAKANVTINILWKLNNEKIE